MAGAQTPVVINEEDPVVAPPLRVLGTAEESTPLEIRLSEISVQVETEDMSPEDEIFVVLAIADLTPPAANESRVVNVVVSPIYDFDTDVAPAGYSNSMHSNYPNIRIWGPAPIWPQWGVLIMASVIESDDDFPRAMGESALEAALTVELKNKGTNWPPDHTMCNLLEGLVGDDDYIRSAEPGRIGSCNSVWVPSEEDLKSAREGEEVRGYLSFERTTSDDPVGWNSPLDSDPDTNIGMDDSRYTIQFTLSR